jgi:hypothetical protein
MGNEIFFITQEMFHVDEEITHKKLKYIDHLELELPKVPTKELYKIQISATQEIQSRAHTDVTSLHLNNELRKTMGMRLK